jgi:DNA sulfur modification protein DndB
MSNSLSYTFPALRGTQASREYYVVMCPLKLLPQLFQFNETTVPQELRTQRMLNQARVLEMARYILNHRADYVFSAATAAIDGEVKSVVAKLA